MAAAQYSQDYDERVVNSWGGDSGAGNCNAYQSQPGLGGQCPIWMGLILPYAKSIQILQCPSATRLNETNPANPQQTHYGIQHNNMGWGLNGTPALPDFAKTADTIYFSDVGRYNSGPGPTEWDNLKNNPDKFTNGNTNVSRSYVQCMNCPTGGPVTATPTCCNDAITVVGRHLETCNVVFLDGHVKAMKVSTLIAPFYNPALRNTSADYWDKF